MSRLPVVHSVAPQFLNFMISRFLVPSICEIVSLASLMTIRFINSRFLHCPQKQCRGILLIHKCLFETKSIGRSSESGKHRGECSRLRQGSIRIGRIEEFKFELNERWFWWVRMMFSTSHSMNLSEAFPIDIVSEFTRYRQLRVKDFPLRNG